MYPKASGARLTVPVYCWHSDEEWRRLCSGLRVALRGCLRPLGLQLDSVERSDVDGPEIIISYSTKPQGIFGRKPKLTDGQTTQAYRAMKPVLDEKLTG